MYTIQLPWKDWEIKEELGRGTSGTVYLAEKNIGGEILQSAIKIISIPTSNSDEADTDIMQEIQIMERLKGLSNIVSIEDVEREETPSSGLKLYIRMEYLQSFPEWKKIYLPQPVAEDIIVRLGTDICKALEECEKKGIVHRDIKPSNIFVSANGHFKLGDFSISRILDKKRIRLTNSGTELYIAPETEKNCSYDARSDIYSLGLVLYELGNNNRMPFETTDQYSANRKRLAGEPIEKDPEMISNHSLAEVIKKAVRFKPEERFQNAAAFSRELQQSISGKRNARIKQHKPQRTPVLRRVDGVEMTPEQEKQVQAACFQYVSGSLNNEADFLRVAAEVLFAGEDCWLKVLYDVLQTNDLNYQVLNRYSFLKVCREKNVLDNKDIKNRLNKVITETDGVCSSNNKTILAQKMIVGTETEEEAGKLDRILKKVPDDSMDELLQNLPKDKLKAKEFVHEVLRSCDLSCLFSMVKCKTILENDLFSKHVKSKYPDFASPLEWLSSFDKNRDLRNTYSHQNKNNVIASMNVANTILQPMFDLCMKLRNPETEKALAEFAEQTISLEKQEDLGFYNIKELTGFDQDDDIQCILNSTKKFIGEEALLTPGYLFCNYQCAGLVFMLAVNKGNDIESDAESLERDLQEMVQELPQVFSLLQLSLQSAGSPLSTLLSQQQIRELCQTHHILVDKTVLMSHAGRDLINDLAKQIPDGRKLLVSTTTRYQLHPENSTDANQEGRAGYILLRALQAAGKAAVIGKEPETSSDDDIPAIEKILQTHDRIRMCIITNNYSAARKAIDLNKYPYLLICKLYSRVLQDEKNGIKAFGICLPVKEKRIKERDNASMAVNEQEEIESARNIHPFFTLGRDSDQQKMATDNKHSTNNTESSISVKSNPPIVNTERQKKDTAVVKTSSATDDQDKQKRSMERKKEDYQSDEIESEVAGKRVFDAERGVVVLKAKIAGGGEGTIWETDRGNCLAKVYHLKYLTENPKIEEKLKAMAGHWPGDHHICSPQVFLYDEMGQFRGFLMRRVPERFLELQKSVLKINVPRIRQKILPNWHRIDLVQATRATALLLEKLHQEGFLMGDINPGNIMIDPGNSRDVYLVDCDSYQFGEYPCPVGMEEYDHPLLAQNTKSGELNYSCIRRKLEDENYSFAILAFQIIFCGSYPFENKGSSSPQECKRKKEFMYGEEQQEIVFENNIIWQQLPKAIRTLFSDTFREWKTADMNAWAKELKNYESQIRKSQENGDSRGFSNELMPKKFREYDSDSDHYRDGICKACGREFNYPRMYKGQERKEKLFCFSCDSIVNRPQELTCDRCGRSFKGLFGQLILNRDGKEILCKECQKKEAGMLSAGCVICGKKVKEPRDIVAGVRKYNNGQYICPDDRYKCEICGRPTQLSINSPIIEEIHSKHRKVYCIACNPFVKKQ